MSRPDHNRANAAQGSAQQARSGTGRVVGYGMGGGAARANSAPCPQHDPFAPVAPHMGAAPVPAANPAMDYARYAQANYVPPATSQPQQPPKKKRRAAFWIGLIAALLCIALAVALAFMLFSGKSKRQGSLGQLEGKSEAEIQAELDRVVDEGMFNISIASVVQMDDGSSSAELRIENVPGNRYLMKVDIVRDDTGEVIYTTDLIEPNYHIQQDTLDASLPAGSYSCTAIFHAFDPESEQEIGQAGAQMTIQVAA